MAYTTESLWKCILHLSPLAPISFDLECNGQVQPFHRTQQFDHTFAVLITAFLKRPRIYSDCGPRYFFGSCPSIDSFRIFK